MEEIITKDKEFKDLVHVIRGQQVMLDSDLAELYGYEVKNLNKQVSRNIQKFPDDFRFQLTMEEANSLRFHFGTLKKARGAHIKYAPYVFTEIGVYMLATVLNGDIATEQSKYIMRSFQKMKHHLAENKMLLSSNELSNINNRLDKHEADINRIMDYFINEDNIKEKLFLDGQVFDAAEAYINIYKQAKKNIYIIDDYINIDTLNLLKHKQNKINITIFTSNKGVPKLSKTEVNKFNIQYPSLLLKFTPNIHDRFIVIDYRTNNEKIYICGTSSKDAGQKICTIIQMQDRVKMHPVIDKLLDSKNYIFND